MIKKVPSLVESGIVFDLVALKIYETDIEVDGYLDTFNNCRETGYMLTVTSTTPTTTVWVYRHRNSDQLVVAIGTMEDVDINNMFNERVYENKKMFACDSYNEAATYILQVISKATTEEVLL